MDTEDLMKPREIWKPILGYEGLYEISNTGKVKSLKRIVRTGNGGSRIIKEKIMKPFWGNKNQLCIFLCKECKSKIKLVYRLMAIAFIKNIENKPTVNHNDGNRRNNNLSNLEWNTWSENNSHAVRIGLNDPIKNLPDNRRMVAMLDNIGNEINQFNSLIEAAKFLNKHPQGISDVCKNKPHCKTAYGYKWKFL